MFQMCACGFSIIVLKGYTEHCDYSAILICFKFLFNICIRL